MAIAIRSTVYHEIIQKWEDIENNYIILRVKIQDREILLGTVYGPNSNDVQFYERIKRICDNENIPVILGGDYNTVLDNRDGELSVDRMGNGNCPNIGNSRFLNNWIAEGVMLDPFRVLYPERTEFSYTSFRRGDNFGKNRLDFFMVSSVLMGDVKNVINEDRIGRDFDHREVKLCSIRKNRRVEKRKYT